MSLSDCIRRKVSAPELQFSSLEKKASSLGYKIKANFVPTEADHLIKSVTQEILGKIEAFLREAKNNNNEPLTYDITEIRASFSKEIETEIKNTITVVSEDYLDSISSPKKDTSPPTSTSPLIKGFLNVVGVVGLLVATALFLRE